ncbi:MAG: SPFH domain-containing protein [Chitinispirillia bacterium]|nr:SPFH domain-containing protein [Chitinispirillia bacterium]MCL2267870.1 SPFH domain-containing protein [Chitinispirillia bacterium]
MGLIKAALGAVGGTLADQWLEFFVCDSLEASVLVAKGQKRDARRNTNVKGESNVISNGSGVVVNKGQAAIIVDNGKIAEFCAEEGRYTYDQSSESSIFYGDFKNRVGGTLKNMWERFKFGGTPGKDQRIYYFNTKEILGNKYGTPAPIPYLIYDPNINLKLTISLRANGEYSYRISDPILFYTNVCGNVDPNYTRDRIDSQLKAEIITVLGPALKELGGLEYHEISFHTERLSEIFNEKLSAKWREHRGIEVASFGITCTASPEDEKRIKQLQATAVMRDPTMAAAHLVTSQGDAMVGAANNQAGMGAMGAFLGMGMAQGAGGINAQNLFQMGGSQQPAPVAGMPGQAANANAWACACGHSNTGKFCAECGAPMPAPAAGWTCACGHANTGKFCADCGAPMPAGPWTCACGHAGNTGKFCAECGKRNTGNNAY